MANWTQLKKDLEANWNIVLPDDVNDVLAGNINSLTAAKPFLIMCVRYAMVDYVKRGIARRLRQAKNTVNNRMKDAQDAYVADNSPVNWPEYSNEEMFAMIAPYYSNAEKEFNYVGILAGKARDARDKVDNLLEQIVSATEK